MSHAIVKQNNHIARLWGSVLCAATLAAHAAAPAGYYLVWSDEFNSASLDTTKWDYWLLGSRRDAVNVTNAVSLDGSHLVITTYTTNSTHYTGMIATDGTFRSRFGYWEASIKWGDTNGMWSAAWMQSPTMGTYLDDPFISGSEIDIGEHRYVDGSGNNLANVIQPNVHWNGYNSSAASSGGNNYGSGLASNYHTYGFLWTTTDYTISIDGTGVRNWNYANNSVPVSLSTEWMILSSEVDDTSTTWAGTIPAAGYGNLGISTTKLMVDYIRYYAPTNSIFWVGTNSTDLSSSANYISSKPALATSDLTFSQLSGSNLNPVLGGSLSVDSLVFTWMNNGLTLGGTSTLTLGAGGIDMLSANHSVSVNCPVNIGSAQTWNIGRNSPGNTLTVNGNISGSATLSKGSYGTLVLAGTNSFTGTLNVGTISSTANDGFLQLASSGAAANAAGIILGNGVTITNSITANTVNSGGGSIGLVMAADNTSATWSGPITFNANATAGGHFAGPTTSGLLTIAGPVNSGATNILIIRAGNLRFSGGGSYGEIQPRANTTSLGANNGIAVNAVMDIGGNGSTMVPTAFDLNGFNQTLAGLKNSVTAANAAWVTNSAATPNTLTLNLGATNFSFGGSLVGKIALTLNSGVQTLAKSGTTALNGLYTYSGNTTVAGGTLALASGISLPNTPVVTIASGATLDASASGLTLGLAQTLGGAGTVLGNLTVNGTLMPGSGGMEVLSCSNNVTLNAGCTNYLELNKSAGTNDQLRVAGSLAYGGQLLVTNLNGSLSGGDTFKLFSAVSSSGNFTTLAGSPGAGLDWKFNPTNGALTVYSTVVTNLTIRVTNSALLISWPADHVGWTLQVQTNALNAGLGTNWISILNTATNTQFAAPLDAGNPAVFYRLIYQ